MRVSLPIALALLASTQCRAATVEEVAERALPGVVEIWTYDGSGSGIGMGSGFFISPRKIVTNEHVVDGAYSAEVFSDQAYYDRVTILNADEDTDLAVLSVDAEGEIPLAINPDAQLRPGQRVIVIGHPLGLERTVSDGLISNVQTIDQLQDVQITAPISPGSSGSPLLDEQGRVIGVVYAGIDEGQNLNFAVGIQTLNEFLALEGSPRQLEVAGTYVPWRVAVKWAVKAVVAVIRLVIGGCLIMVAIVGIVRLWRVLYWLSKSAYRLLTRPFGRRRDPARLATGQRRHPLGLVGRATWRSLWRARGHIAVRAGLIVGGLLLIAAGSLLSAGVDWATKPTKPSESTVAQLEPSPSTDTQSITVYVTRTGTKYHRAGCRYLSKSKIPITLKDAKQHYAPCSVCKPPR